MLTETPVTDDASGRLLGYVSQLGGDAWYWRHVEDDCGWSDEPARSRMHARDCVVGFDDYLRWLARQPVATGEPNA